MELLPQPALAPATMSTTTSGCARCLIYRLPPRRGKARPAGIDPERRHGWAGPLRGYECGIHLFPCETFPPNDQRLCAVDKRTGKRQIVAQLNLRPDEQEGYFCIDTEDGRAL